MMVRLLSWVKILAWNLIRIRQHWMMTKFGSAWICNFIRVESDTDSGSRYFSEFGSGSTTLDFTLTAARTLEQYKYKHNIYCVHSSLEHSTQGYGGQKRKEKEEERKKEIKKKIVRLWICKNKWEISDKRDTGRYVYMNVLQALRFLDIFIRIWRVSIRQPRLVGKKYHTLPLCQTF